MRFLLGFLSGAVALAVLSNPRFKQPVPPRRRIAEPPMPTYWNYHRLSQYDRVNLN